MKNPEEFLKSCYDCPFQIVEFIVIGKAKLSKSKCAAKKQYSRESSEESFCDYCNQSNQKFDKPIIRCELIQALARAFEIRDYEVIQDYYNKIIDIPEWESFVLQTTDIKWELWLIRIGKMLMRKCQIDPNSPFKALLPESGKRH